MTTKLISVREPTRAEKKKHGAEVVFERKGAHGRKHVIYGAKCYESWQQWGEVREVLWDNADAIETWRRRGLAGAMEDAQE